MSIFFLRGCVYLRPGGSSFGLGDSFFSVCPENGISLLRNIAFLDFLADWVVLVLGLRGFGSFLSGLVLF